MRMSMKGQQVTLASAILLLCLLFTSLIVVVLGAPASPLPNSYDQPDGSITPPLYLKGDERYAWLADGDGYTVIRDAEGWFVYARSDGNGGLESAGARVGEVDPKDELGLYPDVLHDHAFKDDTGGTDGRRRRRLGSSSDGATCVRPKKPCENPPCYLKQLALLVRFAGHENRKLPSTEDMHVFFNHNGPTESGAASTGSVSDVYRANSFDTFVMDTHVTPWIQISKTEAYAAQGKNGFNFPETRECWAEAMKQYAESGLANSDLSRFDEDGDGYIDALAIVTSGVAAEVNDVDCETQAPFNERVWSHAAPQHRTFDFLANNGIDLGGIKVGRFYVFSGVYGSCPSSGAGGQFLAPRIATATHELGHYLGFPDLYGKPGKSSGIGNWGFMGNMYGWDASQNWPSLLSAYSRHLVEWVQVVEVTHSRDILVSVSCDSDIVYKISHRMPSDDCGGEYFLIENRGACGYDLKLKEGKIDRQGIVIWHVDHTSILGQNIDGTDVIQYDTQKPPSDAAWPGVHSRLSLLPADGQFELESNTNRGNEYDTFRKAKSVPQVAYKISNSGITMNNGQTAPYPNTKSIATGVEKTTGITIEILSPVNYTMTVRITLLDAEGVQVEKAPTPTKPRGPAPVVFPGRGPTPNAISPPSRPGFGASGSDIIGNRKPTTSVNAPTNLPVKGPVPTTNVNAPTNPPVKGPVPTANVNAPTNPPVKGPVPTANVNAPTNPPVKVPVPVSDNGFVGTCGDSQKLEFEVAPGVGNEDTFYSMIRQCQFISSNPAEREEVFCDAIDLKSEGGTKKVYEKCQKECPTYTGC